MNKARLISTSPRRVRADGGIPAFAAERSTGMRIVIELRPTPCRRLRSISFGRTRPRVDDRREHARDREGGQGLALRDLFVEFIGIDAKS